MVLKTELITGLAKINGEPNGEKKDMSELKETLAKEIPFAELPKKQAILYFDQKVN